MNWWQGNKLLQVNVTNTYKKAPQKVETSINLQAKNVAKSCNIDDRVEGLAKAEAFITFKDHYNNFLSHPTCRLLNPCKSELGEISKCILEEVNNTIKTTLNFNQWKNTNEVVDWVINIYNKHQCTFIQLDIKDFYPSITEEILEKSLEFAKQYVDITEKNIQSIKHCRKSLLFLNDESWKKKNRGVVLT